MSSFILILHKSSEILTFIFNTWRALPKEKADFANVGRMIMCMNKDFVSKFIFKYNTQWKALESLEICEEMFVCLFLKFVFTAAAA